MNSIAQEVYLHSKRYSKQLSTQYGRYIDVLHFPKGVTAKTFPFCSNAFINITDFLLIFEDGSELFFVNNRIFSTRSDVWDVDTIKDPQLADRNLNTINFNPNFEDFQVFFKKLLFKFQENILEYLSYLYQAEINKSDRTLDFNINKDGGVYILKVNGIIDFIEFLPKDNKLEYRISINGEDIFDDNLENQQKRLYDHIFNNA